jgi:hypothetical protein
MSQSVAARLARSPSVVRPLGPVEKFLWLGNLQYETRFGELKPGALWGPAVSLGFANHQTIEVTVDGALCLLHTSYEPIESLLEIAEQILISACADTKSA